ncbi:M20/M25/M40 family metallo-hydrolase [Paenibacillus jiagnxiensis]|uniref:M20/M25/M40 family metallo-hydrolase n=1 Tax=Paenibacillus jiagnxiensis TaxID=3228926 RepID=UPI0033ACD040
MSEQLEINAEKYEISYHVKEVYERLLADSGVQTGLVFLEADNDRTAEEQIELTEIEAPTFEETEKGELYKKKLEELGIQDIQTDEVGNVFGIRSGSGGGPALVVCAHLDTVFPRGTNVIARRKDGKIYAPGISDDGRGLAVVLTLVRALNHAGIKTKGDLIIGATVGEEGLGDLRGVKALFEGRNDLDGFISIEPGEPDRITYLGVGSKRYKVTFRGPGGHSFGDFGTPSPIHALGRAIAELADLQTPTDPKTTFNAGLIQGGTSVNTIAETGEMVLDMRSTSQEQLLKLEAEVLALLERAAEQENRRWNREGAITVEAKLVGDRPAGSQDPHALIVQASAAATAAIGFEPVLGEASSTDSNIPIYLGIPAVTLGGGGDYGGVHTLDEYFDPQDSYLGAQKVFLTVLGLAGFEGVSDPLLAKR